MFYLDYFTFNDYFIFKNYNYYNFGSLDDSHDTLNLQTSFQFDSSSTIFKIRQIIALG